MYTNKGFTLIEIIVVVAIFLILGALAVPELRYFQAQTTLNDDAKAIINILRLSQNKTLASEGATNYGVHFENKSYVLFAGSTYSATATTNVLYNLSPKIEIYEINFNGDGQEIVFNRITGTTSQYGAVKLRLTDSPGQTKTISVDETGQIFSGTSDTYPAPTNKDNRHVHFSYNKGIKTALVLRLYFPDDNFTYDINFQNYLNTAKDEFNWQDTITVNNQNQTLKIHTHFLTDTSAQFSIHRDRRYNNKAVNISLDGDNLINYAADGSVTRGTSPFITEPEKQ